MLSLKPMFFTFKHHLYSVCPLRSVFDRLRYVKISCFLVNSSAKQKGKDPYIGTPETITVIVLNIGTPEIITVIVLNIGTPE